MEGQSDSRKSFTQLTELGSCNERGAANFYKAWRRDLATLKTFCFGFEQVVRKTKEIINKTSTMKNLSAKSEFPNTPPTGCQHISFQEILEKLSEISP
jgi:hypothetical protein